MTDKNTNQSLEQLTDNSNSKSGHFFFIPILAGNLFGAVISGTLGFGLGMGSVPNLSHHYKSLLAYEGVGLALTTLGFLAAPGTRRKRDFLYVPAIYAGVQTVSFVAGYGAGSLVNLAKHFFN